MNETNDNWGGVSGISITGTNIGTSLYSPNVTVLNSDNINRQVKVAVFEVSRNKDNKVVSSKLVKELWVE